ncbi:MAG: hypothetical protein N4A45_09560 [Flavobacteriales bacterium]|jgi:hypothetical protein|nr:hypothetical protein [Flavobacteriales bacterium]
MKTILAYLLLIFFVSEISVAQQSFHVYIEEGETKIDETSKMKLKGKIQNYFFNNGILTSGTENMFIAYCNLEVYDEKNVDIGLETINMFEGMVQLTLTNIKDQIIFGSKSFNFKHTSSSRKRSISQGINSLKLDREDEGFLDMVLSNIHTYYNKNCDNIIDQAFTHKNVREYEKALSIAKSIPFESNCSYQRNVLIEEIEREYRLSCNDKYDFAQSLFYQKKYFPALSVLSTINNRTACTYKKNVLRDQIHRKIESEDLKKWNLKVLQILEKSYLKKLELKYSKEVALAKLENNKRAMDLEFKAYLIDSYIDLEENKKEMLRDEYNYILSSQKIDAMKSILMEKNKKVSHQFHVTKNYHVFKTVQF